MQSSSHRRSARVPAAAAEHSRRRELHLERLHAWASGTRRQRRDAVDDPIRLDQRDHVVKCQAVRPAFLRNSVRGTCLNWMAISVRRVIQHLLPDAQIKQHARPPPVIDPQLPGDDMASRCKSIQATFDAFDRARQRPATIPSPCRCSSRRLRGRSPLSERNEYPPAPFAFSDRRGVSFESRSAIPLCAIKVRS